MDFPRKKNNSPMIYLNIVHIFVLSLNGPMVVYTYCTFSEVKRGSFSLRVLTLLDDMFVVFSIM